MLEWPANYPKRLLQQAGGRIRGHGGWFLRSRGGKLISFGLNFMSDCRRGRDLLVIRHVLLSQSIPRVLQLAGNVHLPPGGLNRPTPPRTKSGYIFQLPNKKKNSTEH